MFYKRIFKAFQDIDLKYAVIGGVAVNLHGYARATGDLDIVVLLDNEELQKFITVVKKLGMVPRLPVRLEDLCVPEVRKMWVEEKNMKVFSVYNPKDPMEHIDLMCEINLDLGQIIENRVIMQEGDVRIPVASIDDLIRLKEIAGRQRDQIDIAALKKIREIQKDNE